VSEIRHRSLGFFSSRLGPTPRLAKKELVGFNGPPESAEIRVKVAVFSPSEGIEDVGVARDIESGFSSFDRFREYLAQGKGKRAGVFVSNDLALATDEIEELVSGRNTAVQNNC